ncbi:hypothetical protein L8R84_25085, partial [Vibrio splendidus]|uniref:hypothetical protein n=1 Tax=Vibrio splendidus TaxID=29497 RepID=UPI0024686EA9
DFENFFSLYFTFNNLNKSLFLLSLYFSQTTIHIEINVPWCVVTNSTNQQLRTNDLSSLIKAAGKTDSERQKPTRWRMNLTNEGCGGSES